MRRLAVGSLLAALLFAAWLPGSALAASSPNVKEVAQIPTLVGAISINFIDDTMFVSTVHGVYSYDVSDPTSPKLLGALPMYIWENEDVDVDPIHKRLFVSRDPRGFTSPAVPGDVFPYGAVHIIDVSDPASMSQINVFLVPAGHTTTCVNKCDFIWTAGPYANKISNADFVGRPIYATDVTDPANPKPCPDPIDTGHNDGVTDYVHDVQVDAAGVAWVTGQGGVRGYWTSGDHLNPVSGKVETATGCKPVPYAGSGTPETATPSRFMHNSWRDWTPPAPAANKAKPKPRKRAARRRHSRERASARRRASAHRRRAAHRRASTHRRARKTAATEAPLTRNDVLLATEENTVTDCKTSGRFVTYDLRGTYDGEGFRDTAKTKNRMRVLDTWTPENQPGSSGCDSSHYFASRGDGITTNAFYTQGVRFLDTSDPSNIRQVGYFVNADSNTWASYWHKGYVFVADLQRGVDVLKFDGGPNMGPTVTAPVVSHAASNVKVTFDSHVFSGLCPLRVTGV